MHLRPFEYGNLIYDNFVFDIPRLIDFAMLYGQEFPDVVSEIFRVVFEAQPKYTLDAVTTMKGAVTVRIT